VCLDSNAGGTFGSIYKVKDASTGSVYAMKCPKFLDQCRLNSIRNELEAYLELGTHQGIVQVKSFFVLKDIPHIIMSYASEGSLETWLSIRPGSGMNAPRLAPRICTEDDSASSCLLSPRHTVCRVVDVLVQLADALAFAHEKGFIHADVKPGKVLVTRTHSAEGLRFLNVKLCDFGICGHVSVDRVGSSSAGADTKSYQSPEQANNETITAKSDVWSLSVLAALLLNKCTSPFTQRASDLRHEIFCNDLLEWMIANSTCQYMRELVCILRAGMETSPHLRPSMLNLLSGLLHLANVNSLCNIEALEVFDLVIVRLEQRRSLTKSVENDSKLKLRRMEWMTNWFAEVCRDNFAADQLHQRILAMYPDHPQVYGNYAVYLEKTKLDFSTAEIYYCKALELTPENATLICNAAEFYHNSMGDTAKSFHLLKKCVELDPTNPVAIGLLAVVYEHNRDYTNAEQCYLKAMELDSNSPIRSYNYALFLEQYKGDLKKAEEYYRKSIAIQPDYTSALYNLGDLLESKSDLIAVEKVYQRLLQVDPNHVDGLNNYGQLMVRKESYQLADTLFTKLLQIDPNHLAALCNYGMLLYYKKDGTNALVYFNRAIAIDSTHSHALYCIGLCHTYCTKDLETAAIYYEKAIASNPENSYALYPITVIVTLQESNRPSCAGYV